MHLVITMYFLKFISKNGNLGLGDYVQRNTPTIISILKSIIQVSAGGNNVVANPLKGGFSLALNKSGNVFSWGSNDVNNN
jgi:alpha-tubulin suppressor-like RCC1 family protein